MTQKRVGLSPEALKNLGRIGGEAQREIERRLTAFARSLNAAMREAGERQRQGKR